MGKRTAPPTQGARAEAFQAQAFPHLDAVYSDAFCLAGNAEDAADLVVSAYVRAFAHHDRFRRPGVFGRSRARDTLLQHLHAAFCDGILSQATPDKTPTGE